MGEFSAEWLALREPADHRARNQAVAAAVGAMFAGRESARLVDLGCGTGSNLRALAPTLPHIQHWRLVDADSGLLGAARMALAQWAEGGTTDPDGTLRISRHGKMISVLFEQADIASEHEPILDPTIDLVTAAAFFDLAAPAWIAEFCAGLIARRLPLYAVLTYNGAERWRPPHFADHAMLSAFGVHQRTDKGFGIAAGPDAIDCLIRAFAGVGWDVQTGHSDWRLTGAEADLVAMLAAGSASAVTATGLVPAADCAAWLAARRAASSCLIGHTDILARVPA